MAQRKLTEQQARETIDTYDRIYDRVVDELGQVPTGWSRLDAEVGRELGLKPSSVHGRRTRALELYGLRPTFPSADEIGTDRPSTPPPILPDMPSPVVPAEEYLEHLKARQARQKTYVESRRWMPVQVPGTKPFAVAWVGDPHLDSSGCDLETLERDVVIMRETPRMYAVCAGDVLDNWPHGGRLSKLMGTSDVSNAQARELATWFLKRSGISWLMWLHGNHDTWNDGHLVTEAVNGGQVPMQEWGAQFELKCGNASWRVWARHDFPHGSQWNPLHGVMKAASTWEPADLYLAGHRHNWALFRGQHEHRGHTYWCARARGYKTLHDDHAYRVGYGDRQDTGESVTSVFNPRTGYIWMSEDIEAAAAYLKSLLK